MNTPKPKTAIITSDNRRLTFAGTEADTSEGSVVGVPDRIKKGDKIRMKYITGSYYGLWSFDRLLKKA